jgi:hypothetical protein
MGEVLKMPEAIRYKCPGCGADSGCNCGLPPVLKAQQAIAAHPEKTNRVLADEAGVSRETVRRVRSVDTSVPTEKRKGKDGKSYKAHKPKPKNDDPTGEDPFSSVQEFEESPIAWKNRAEMAATQARYAPLETCPTTKAMRRLAKDAMEAWQSVYEYIGKETNK